MTERQRLIDMLILHEGVRLKPYMDTVGKITIGVGRNLSDKGISNGEAMLLLDHDVDEAITDLMRFPWFWGLDPIRQRVLEDLRFNLGPDRLRMFTRTLRLVSEHDFARAASALRESKWYGQVKTRGVRLVQMLKTGEDYV